MSQTPTNEIKPEDVRINVQVSTLKNPGAVDLSKFPLLVHAPRQHGDEIATEDVGAKVSDICNHFAASGDASAVAARFGTTTKHVEQAIAYAHAAQYTVASQTPASA